ncbi:MULTISPECIES: ImmA/IrrE family metallo-endopeptidase [Staphylococcus]|uniref:ImmA/IrrE family metallo-endopeptidase n=1 Tax=Staphylococcus TaxID=1279 RepID=UPI0021D390A2|nr:ImmA/IrrE family metallo-endopeptidase [Staphylococcus arlettae]UXU48947.1 ImmA/IrrE family metallo-endopeptidase [Staphylococcus arlettae]
MQINVCGINYDVIQVTEVDNDPSCLGLCIYRESLIQIKNGLSTERKKQVLMHELLHAILYEAGYEEHNEEQVKSLSVVINQVIAQNNIKATLNELEQLSLGV